MVAIPLKNKIQQQAYRIVFWQWAGIFLFACLGLMIHGLSSGLSVLLGGFCYGLPNLIFVWRVFRYAGAHQMTQFLAAFFLGEMIKLILSGVLFLLIVKYLPVSLLSVLIGFLCAIVSFWIACISLFGRQKTY